MQTPYNKHSSSLIDYTSYLYHLRLALKKAINIDEKLNILNTLPEVKNFFSSPSAITSLLTPFPPQCEYVIKAIIAIKQSARLFILPQEPNLLAQFRVFLEKLLEIEAYYSKIGGIVGYQYLVFKLLKPRVTIKKTATLLPPTSIDLRGSMMQMNKVILTAIRNQEQMSEFYPLGGVADRLGLKDTKTGKALPSACFTFLGKTLLTRAIEDLQAREYLHYKLFNNKITTPILMMTSKTDHHDAYIYNMCEKNHWFRRSKANFFFITQPSMPVFTQDGDWCLHKPLKLFLKPGGHGMLWSLLDTHHAFEWCKKRGRKKTLIRQINNPMAGTDYGLLAFLGFGHENNKTLGFASCPRLINAQEGINVIKEKKYGDHITRVLTNVEYCDHHKFKIHDLPHQPQGESTHFPSNTNILFVDLGKIKQAIKKNPFPGPVINFRMGTHYHSKRKKERIARVEIILQNIADVIDADESYLTFNERCKTISTIKRQSISKKMMLETPEACYYDHLLNAQEILTTHCHFFLPSMPNKHIFLQEGPPFLFNFHPALGPLYSIIGQKIQRGRLHKGAELQLEIADLEIKHLDIDGSMLIHAHRVMGDVNKKDMLQYSNDTGQCYLKNVHVRNRGIDWGNTDLFQNYNIQRHAALKIILYGHSQFIAENVTIHGNLTLKVPDGICMIAKEERGDLIFTTHSIEHKEPFWTYTIDQNQSIKIKNHTLNTRND